MILVMGLSHVCLCAHLITGGEWAGCVAITQSRSCWVQPSEDPVERSTSWRRSSSSLVRSLIHCLMVGVVDACVPNCICMPLCVFLLNLVSKISPSSCLFPGLSPLSSHLGPHPSIPSHSHLSPACILPSCTSSIHSSIRASFNTPLISHTSTSSCRAVASMTWWLWTACGEYGGV